MPTYGKLDSFDESEDWAQYVERMEHYFNANEIDEEDQKSDIFLSNVWNIIFNANEIDEEDQKSDIFLSVCGKNTYKLIRDLLAPAKPGTKSLADLTKLVKDHRDPVPSEIIQRFKFNSRTRHSDESVRTFIAALRSLTEHCNYGDTLNAMLRDRLVVGIKSDRIQRRLLAEPNLTFDKALEIATAMETAEKNAQDIQASGTNATFQKQQVEFSDWAAPIVPVVKENGSIRICGDYKVTVNAVSKLDNYPIPKTEDLYATLRGRQEYTKLDLNQAYQQIELDEDSIRYVTINTHKGLFRYNRLPYGVAYSPGIFHRTLENVVQGISNVLVRVDDILITGKTREEHLNTLSEVLSRFKRIKIRLKKQKCVFMAEEVVYLGFKINKHGIYLVESKIEAIDKAPSPTNVTELKAYLGMLNYYNKFLANLSHLLKPLHVLLQKDTKWSWEKEQEKAFIESKQLLKSASVLVHFDPKKKLILACDASPYGVGAVLSHKMDDGSDKPIAYTSRTLTSAEKYYSVLEKESLAIIFGIKKFHQYLYGHPITIITDHKPIIGLFLEDKPIPTTTASRIQKVGTDFSCI
ncbi:unnamed protein product [Mytilus coruscus]|uniref:Reverse transcriptase domain-containing protein n=1 Tax=Mytilus coruscus TaxID=42192 RepID=A0A6J8C7L9_MYTCO|nr:unnamed protein product [Mytilus coruscus]